MPRSAGSTRTAVAAIVSAALTCGVALGTAAAPARASAPALHIEPARLVVTIHAPVTKVGWWVRGLDTTAERCQVELIRPDRVRVGSVAHPKNDRSTARGVIRVQARDIPEPGHLYTLLVTCGDRSDTELVRLERPPSDRRA